MYWNVDLGVGVLVVIEFDLSVDVLVVFKVGWVQ